VGVEWSIHLDGSDDHRVSTFFLFPIYSVCVIFIFEEARVCVDLISIENIISRPPYTTSTPKLNLN
jgi:hypothetical protein